MAYLVRQAYQLAKACASTALSVASSLAPSPPPTPSDDLQALKGVFEPVPPRCSPDSANDPASSSRLRLTQSYMPTDGPSLSCPCPPSQRHDPFCQFFHGDGQAIARSFRDSVATLVPSNDLVAALREIRFLALNPFIGMLEAEAWFGRLTSRCTASCPEGGDALCCAAHGDKFLSHVAFLERAHSQPTRGWTEDSWRAQFDVKTVERLVGRCFVSREEVGRAMGRGQGESLPSWREYRESEVFPLRRPGKYHGGREWWEYRKDLKRRKPPPVPAVAADNSKSVDNPLPVSPPSRRLSIPSAFLPCRTLCDSPSSLSSTSSPLTPSSSNHDTPSDASTDSNSDSDSSPGWLTPPKSSHAPLGLEADVESPKSLGRKGSMRGLREMFVDLNIS